MNHEFLLALLGVYNAHRRMTRAAIMNEELSDGYPKVLMNLAKNEGCLQKELATICSVEPATMTVLIRGMMKRGLVRREATHVSGGKRAFRIFLTEEGWKYADRMHEIFSETTDRALKDLSPEEVQTVIALLRRAEASLTEDEK